MVVALLASALAGCRGPEGEWLVEQIDGQSIAGKPAVVTFRKGRVSASAGCNSMAGDYRTRPGAKLKVVDLNMTVMACMGAEGERSMALEEVLGARLGRARTFARGEDGELLLAGDQGRLLLRPRPPPVRTIEGDWTICRSSPPTRAASEPLRVVRFHGGVVEEWAGCRGVYSLNGSVLRLRFDPTPKCRAAVASARRALSARDLPSHDAILPGPDQALLAAQKPNRVEFTHGDQILRGAPGTELRLCKADPVDLVPRSAWTLAGDWVSSGGVTGMGPTAGGYPGDAYRVSFNDGVVNEAAGCRGTYALSGDRLTFDFPTGGACRVDHARDGRLVSGRGRALLPAFPRQAQVRFRRADTVTVRFAQGVEIHLRRPSAKAETPP
ncbi:MAG TPA: META domain-containing protein [Caulobacter sp.]|nr:META domain-containing protein [Caulobacter sp.]